MKRIRMLCAPTPGLAAYLEECKDGQASSLPAGSRVRPREHRAALHSRHEHTDDVTCRQHDAVRDRHLSADGFESTFAVNHLAPFLLTNLLLDRLRENAPARIVNVSSGVHGSGRIDLDDLQMERRFDGWAAYCNSEVAGVTGAYFVDRRRARASSATDDRRLAKELWRVSEALTGLGVARTASRRVITRTACRTARWQ